MSNIIRSNHKVAKGSPYDVANSRNDKVENVLTDVDRIIIIDHSGSMHDMTRSGRSKADLAQEALDYVQRAYPGRTLIIAFDNTPKMCLDGKVPAPSGSTAMHLALDMAKNFDGTDVEFILISDGEPDLPQVALSVASTFEDPINTIFIGDDHNIRARDIMNQLAGCSRKKGKPIGKVEPEMLQGSMMRLLTSGK